MLCQRLCCPDNASIYSTCDMESVPEMDEHKLAKSMDCRTECDVNNHVCGAFFELASNVTCAHWNTSASPITANANVNVNASTECVVFEFMLQFKTLSHLL